MSDTFKGDVLLISTDDGGDIELIDGLVKCTTGFETAAFLSLFGGNETDDGTEATKARTWWGNLLEPDNPERWIVSRTQALVTGLPATPANLRRVEEAAALDLAWFKSQGIADEIEITAIIPARNRLGLSIEIRKAETKLAGLRFEINWLGQSAGAGV